MGVDKCVANGCKSSVRDYSKIIHRYPRAEKDPERYAIWVKFASNAASWIPNRYSGLCSDHFEASCWLGERRQILRSNAIPTLIGNSKVFDDSTEKEDLLVQSETGHAGNSDIVTDSENVENIPFSSWHENGCEACQPLSEEPCWVHARRYTDGYVPFLSVASLPDQLYLDLRRNMRKDQAVFAKEPLERGAIFGPLVAPLSDKYQSSFPYAIRSETTREIQYFQLEYDRFANWMKYVRRAENTAEQNVAVHLQGSEVFFVTTKRILPGQELKVGYSRKYTEFISGCIDSTLPDQDGLVGLVLPQDMGLIQLLNHLLKQDSSQEQENIPSKFPVQRNPNHQADVPDSPDHLLKNENLIPSPADESSCAFTISVIPSDLIPVDQNVLLADHGLGVDVQGSGMPKAVHRRKKRKIGVDGPDPPKRSRQNKKDAEMIADPSESVPPKGTEPTVNVDGLEAPRKVRCKKKKVHKQQIVKCEVCGLQYTCPKYVQHHVRKAHPEYYADWPYECSECQRRFPSQMSMMVHTRNQHKRAVLTVTPTAVEEAIEHIKTTATFTYYCSTCVRHYPNKKIYDLHQFHHIDADITDHPERDCPVCEYHGPDFSALIAHTLEHGARAKDPKPCLICGKYVKGMKSHVRRDHPVAMQRIQADWEYRCDECEINFKQKRGLDLHTKTVHKGFRCTYCALVIMNSTEMGLHVMQHKTGDVFPCPMCDKTFHKYPFLNNHYRTHHDVTKIKTCPHCLKFNSFGDDYKIYAKHVVRCATGKPPPRKKYKFVKKAFDKNQRLACKECGQLFTSDCGRWRHVQIVHRGNAELQARIKQRKEEGRKRRGVTYVGPRKRLALSEFPHQCVECQLGFIKEAMFYKHQESRHPETIADV